MKVKEIQNQIYDIEMEKYDFLVDNTGDGTKIEIFSKNGDFINFLTCNYELIEIEEIVEILENSKNVNFDLIINI